jgi:hypothetical protein
LFFLGQSDACVLELVQGGLRWDLVVSANRPLFEVSMLPPSQQKTMLDDHVVLAACLSLVLSFASLCHDFFFLLLSVSCNLKLVSPALVFVVVICVPSRLRALLIQSQAL